MTVIRVIDIIRSSDEVKIMQESRSEAPKYIAAYLIINGLFLLPTNMEYISEEIGLVFLYVIVVYYFLFGLGYIHVALNAGFLLYSVLKIILSKERDWVMFAVSVLAVAFSTWSNIFFLQH